MSRRGVPNPSSTQTSLRDPQLQEYQVPSIGVVLQGDTIWLDQKGAVLCKEPIERAAAGTPVKPKHHGAVLGVVLRLHKPGKDRAGLV